jgi:hypothetical protein
VNRAQGAAALLGMLALTACGGAPAPAPGSSSGSPAINVTGTLDRGPVPTCPTDEPCDPPLVASRLAFSRTGSPDVIVRVAGDGSFATHLDPGAYTIAAQPPPFSGQLEPSSVRVPDSGSVELRLRVVRVAA